MLTGLLLFEGDAPGWTVVLNDLRRGPDDAHAVGGRRRGGFDNERGEEFGEQIGTEAVDTHVDLIALLSDGADGVLGDTGVVPEDVETGFLGEKLFNALGDGGEVVQVEAEALELRRVTGWRCGSGGLDLFDRGGDSARRAAGDVDGAAAFGVEHLDQLEPDPCVAPGHDDDFAMERWDVLWDELRSWWSHLRPYCTHGGTWSTGRSLLTLAP